MSVVTDDLTAFTQKLVQTRSVTGEETEVVSQISAEMTRLGFDLVWVDEFGSAIGIIEGAQPGPTILLDGHCDTVEANPPDWNHGPWDGAISGGRLFGRGSADMKGSLAAMIHAAGSLDRKSLKGRIAVSATVTEEYVEGGSLRSVIEQVQPDFVIIGEATELNLNRGGRGRAEIQVTTYGRSAHSSSPSAGRCAVTDMIRVIQSISTLETPQDAFLGPGSMVLTDIISAPHPGHSVLPYRCHVTYDRRLLNGETRESLLSSLTNLPDLSDVKYEINLATQEEHTYTGKLLKGDKYFPAWLFGEDDDFVQAALKGLMAAGLNPELRAYRFCTNAAFSAGVLGLPTVGFGIGREEDAHTVDESISLSDLHTAVAGYQGIIKSVCCH